MTIRDLKPELENRLRINVLLAELSDLIQESSSVPDLGLDFDHWAETIFGPITGYGGDDDPIPPVFLEAFDHNL